MISPARSASFVLLAWCACAHPSPRHASVAPPVDASEVAADRTGSKALAKHQTAGVAVAVMKHGKLVLAKGYGFADVGAKIPADAHTVFRIGSLTKQFTAAAIMQLVEHGKLGLDEDATKYVSFPTGGNTITIRQLLEHTSGIPNYTDVPAFGERMAAPATPAQLVALIADQPWGFAPGTEFRYSNTGYIVLGMVIEKVSGQSYAAYLASHVVAPAGLHATAYCDERTPDPHRARGYQPGQGALIEAAPIDMSIPYAAGAMCSTVEDLVTWQTALASGKVVSAASYRQMITPPQLPAGAKTSYGFGLMVDDFQGHRRVWHNGEINGFSSELHAFPADDLVVAVLGNTESGVPPRLADVVARAALGIPVTEIVVPPHLRAEIVGNYEVTGLGTVEVLVDDGDLVFAPVGQPHFPLEYQGTTTFKIPSIGVTVVFEVEQGKAVGFTTDQAGHTLHGTRLP